MNPVIIIPTYVSMRPYNERGSVVSTYDHVTALSRKGELPRLLDSLQHVNGVGQIVVLVASETTIARQALEKVQAIAAQYPQLSIAVVGQTEVAMVRQRMEEEGFGNLTKEICLTGYGAIKNFGLVLANIFGFDAAVFIDDDEVIDDPRFLENAVYGLGKLTRKGVPILAKTGYYLNAEGSYLSMSQNKWYNHFWQQGGAFNKWISRAMQGPRLSRSNHVCGGCLILHREAFRRLSFDPWISRGEDLDYMLNLRMYGSDIWFDNKWQLRHLPPETKNEGIRFRQDVYRWLYEFRKMEYSRTQIDLLQVKPSSLEPYPGPFLEEGIGRRIRITAALRSFASKDGSAYRDAARVAKNEADQYAQRNCSKYFGLQLVWSKLMERLENDARLAGALADSINEGQRQADEQYARQMANASASARPRTDVRPSASGQKVSLDPGATGEIRLNIEE